MSEMSTLERIKHALSNLKMEGIKNKSKIDNYVIFIYLDTKKFCLSQDSDDLEVFVQYKFYYRNGFTLDFPYQMESSSKITQGNALVELLKSLSFKPRGDLSDSDKLGLLEFGVFSESVEVIDACCGFDIDFVTTLTDKIFKVVWQTEPDYKIKIEPIFDEKSKENVLKIDLDTNAFFFQTERQRGQIADDVKILVWRRDGGKCVKCGSQENLEFDHIIPFSKGGSSTVRNIQILCELCNRQKGASI
ncbi:MAG: HNH endonuclease [Candidatus Omnitrophota bacterium]